MYLSVKCVVVLVGRLLALVESVESGAWVAQVTDSVLAIDWYEQLSVLQFYLSGGRGCC